MMMLIALIAPLILALSVSAVPCAARSTGCDISNVTIAGFPSTFPAPINPLAFVSIGVGIQNYTCSAEGNYTSIGVVAEIYDLSCLTGSTLLSISDVLIAAWKNEPGTSILAARQVVEAIAPLSVLGEYFFVNNPVGSGIAPVWDFTSSQGNPLAFVLATKAASIPAPTGPQDVDWVALTAVSGSLAQQVYRTDTREGQPPASCTPGSSDIQVKYVAKYFFYHSTL